MFILMILVWQTSCTKNSAPDADNPPDPVTDAEITDAVLTQNLDYPWEILWGPDNMIWMTERGGRISRVNPVNGMANLLLTIPEVLSISEAGLLGMVLHPDFSSNPYLYVAYNYSQGGSYKEKIVRYTYSGNTLNSPQTILDNITGANFHNGCRLLITPDLKLMITTGDAYFTNNPQDISSLNGKVLRINLDGSVPSDNPFPGNPVWSYGHRNPQGLVLANNILYISEHGPSSDDEVNIIEKGRNYGWPDVLGFCNESAEQTYCAANNIKEPIYAWTPTIAPSGLDYYNHDRLPQWKNSLLLATLKNSRLYQIKLNADYKTVKEVNEYFRDKYGRMRDVCISPEGRVYICTSNGNNDKIIVIDRKQ